MKPTRMRAPMPSPLQRLTFALSGAPPQKQAKDAPLFGASALERGGRPQKLELDHCVSTLTSLVRPEAPALIATAALRHLKCSATKATSSSLALPSTGGDFNFATHVPSDACSSDDVLARGFTLT